MFLQSLDAKIEKYFIKMIICRSFMFFYIGTFIILKETTKNGTNITMTLVPFFYIIQLESDKTHSN